MTKANAVKMKKNRRCILMVLFVLNAENTVDELKYRTRERTDLAGSTAGGVLASARVSGGLVVRTHLAVGTRRIADSYTTHNSHIAAQFSASVHKIHHVILLLSNCMQILILSLFLNFRTVYRYFWAYPFHSLVFHSSCSPLSAVVPCCRFIWLM